MSGKNYVIKLSDNSETYSGIEYDELGRKKNVDFKLKEQETLLITGLFQGTMNDIKDKLELLRCLETIDRIENTDHDSEIIFDEEEIGWLQAGIEKTVGRRNHSFVKCKNVIRQIVKPEEKEL